MAKWLHAFREIWDILCGAMNPFFIWLEATPLSIWVRESITVWAFPTVLSLHTIGMGFVAGLNWAIALRMLGVAPFVPLLELKRFFPLIWIAFWLNAVSGVVLLIGYPTKALTNPMFYLKLGFIALALVAFRMIRNTAFRDSSPVTRKGKLLAGASLACWAAAITSGRLLAYTYSRLTAT
jgi:hypothetical protein